MAEQFSVPQKQVSKELDGESYSWPTPGSSTLACPRDTSHPPLVWIPPGYHFTERELPCSGHITAG